MSSEVSLPLAAALNEIARRRTPERPAPAENAAETGAENRFDAMVRQESAAERAAERAETRRRAPNAERLMPGQLSRAAKADPRPAKPDAPAGREAEPPAPEASQPEIQRREHPEHKAGHADSREAPAETGAEAPETASEATESATETADAAADAVDAADTATDGEGSGDGEAASEPETLLVEAAPTEGEAAAPVIAPVIPAVATAETTAATATGTGSAPEAVGAVGTATGAATPESATTIAGTEGAPTDAAATPVATETPRPARSPVPAIAAAAREARPAEGSQGVGETVSDAAKAGNGIAPEGKTAEGKVESGIAPRAEFEAAKRDSLHPTRAAPFAEILESFHGGAIHKPADILAGLDRANAANATARHGEVSRPTPLQMLPIEIGMQAVRGATSFQIRLDPAELGRIDVRLQIKENGEVNANLVVDRVETLAMLRRDASTLQQAFEQAGLRQSADGLSFSLRGEGQNGEGRQNDGQPGRQDAIDEAALNMAPVEVAMRRVMIPNASIDRMI